MKKFRFQDLEIWKDAVSLFDSVFHIAEELENRKMYSFAEQLRRAGMSISNNIAEGSGSSSDKDFKNFIKFAKRSAFETANILIVLAGRNLVEKDALNDLLEKLDHLCRKMTNFQKSLNG
jgi:four helix bundle protein